MQCIVPVTQLSTQYSILVTTVFAISACMDVSDSVFMQQCLMLFVQQCPLLFVQQCSLLCLYNGV